MTIHMCSCQMPVAKGRYVSRTFCSTPIYMDTDVGIQWIQERVSSGTDRMPLNDAYVQIYCTNRLTNIINCEFHRHRHSMERR